MTLLRFSQILQLIISVIMVMLVLIQSKGKGLSSSFNMGAGSYGTRRGLEKIVFIVTIIAGIMLVANSVLIIYLS